MAPPSSPGCQRGATPPQRAPARRAAPGGGPGARALAPLQERLSRRPARTLLAHPRRAARSHRIDEGGQSVAITLRDQQASSRILRWVGRPRGAIDAASRRLRGRKPRSCGWRRLVRGVRPHRRTSATGSSGGPAGAALDLTGRSTASSQADPARAYGHGRVSGGDAGAACRAISTTRRRRIRSSRGGLHAPARSRSATRGRTIRRAHGDGRRTGRSIPQGR